MVAVVAFAIAGIASAETWHGLTVAPENRCSAYDKKADYPYPQSVENHIVRQLGTVYGPYTGSYFASTKETGIVCETYERTVGRDNCVSFDRTRLQIPAQTHRCHFIKARVRVHRYPDGRLPVFHGPRKLADYQRDGSLMTDAPTAGHEHRARGAAAR